MCSGDHNAHTDMLTMVYIPLFIAVVAVVYSCILPDAGGMPWFIAWRNFLQRKLMAAKNFNVMNGFSAEHPHPENPHRDHPYIFKLLIDCEKCIAGQMALWGWLLYRWHAYTSIKWKDFYSVFIILSIHIIIISMSILWACIIKKIYQWTKKI